VVCPDKEVLMVARSSRTPVPTSTAQSLLRLVRVTSRTAAQGAQDVGAQLVTMAEQTVRGTQAASAAIVSDLSAVAARTVAGMRQAAGELRSDVAGMRAMRRPGARMRARRAAVKPRRGRRGPKAATM
jgi:hypothetical protein